MGALIIRPARAADLPRVAEMLRALAEREGELDRCRTDAARLARRVFASPPGVELLVAEENRRVVGYASFLTRFNVWMDSDFIALDDLYVDPDRRSVGIGRALMLHLADIALERGLSLRWEAMLDNPRAAAFYHALGAHDHGKRVFWWHPGAMAATLATAPTDPKRIPTHE